MKIVLINTYVLKECACLFIAYFFVLTQKSKQKKSRLQKNGGRSGGRTNAAKLASHILNPADSFRLGQWRHSAFVLIVN